MLLARAVEAQRRGDSGGARALAAQALDRLLASEDQDPRARAEAFTEIGRFLYQVGDLPSSRRAHEESLAILSTHLAPEDLRLLNQEVYLANALRDLGQLNEARELLEEVLAVETRTLPSDHRALQAARTSLASIAFTLGDVGKARKLFESVLDVFEQTLPAEHADIQSARSNLAVVMEATGDLAGAAALMEEVLEVTSRKVGEDHPDLQTARTNVAVIRKRLGDLAGARALEELVLESFERSLPDEHPTLQAIRLNHAGTLKAMGELAEARALEERVLAQRLKSLPDEHMDLQKARHNLGGTLYTMGELQAARELQEKVLEVETRTLPDDHAMLQQARTNLAATLLGLGDLQGARELFEKALGVLSRVLPDTDRELQSARMNLAVISKKTGDFAGARALQEKVVEVLSQQLPDDHPDLQIVRLNLATTMQQQGEERAALELQERALSALQRTLPEDHPHVQTARRNLAITRYRAGDRAGARELMQQALEASTRTLPDEHHDLQASRVDIALSIAFDHSPSAALEETERERVSFERLALDHARALDRAAARAVLEAGPREAEERCATLGEDVGRTLSLAAGLGVFATDPVLQQAAFVASERTRGAAILSARALRAARSDARYEERRARLQEASAELARGVEAQQDLATYAAARARRETAERELFELAASLQGGTAAALSGGVAELSAVLAEDEAAIVYRRYAREVVGGTPGVTSIDADSLCAFVLRSGQRLERVEFGSVAPIAEEVRAWRRALGIQDAGLGRRGSAGGEEPERGIAAPGAAADDDRAVGATLRESVFDGLRPYLSGVRRLIVCPDDVVHLIPLDALPAGEGELRLGDEFEIVARTTLLELLLSPGPYPGERTLIALANPGFDDEPEDALMLASTVEQSFRTNPAVDANHDARMDPRCYRESSILRGTPWESGFSELPGTQREVEGIVAYFSRWTEEQGSVVRLEGANASRPRLFAEAQRARFLHLATHGWFAPDSLPSWGEPEPLDAQARLGFRPDVVERVRGMNPMLLCGLALAGANRSAAARHGIPGTVTAEELSTLDLSNCELAVVSACETNVGLHRAGQGVASLQRAMRMAGARTVVTSLWRVPDDATESLMVDFYRRIWIEGKPKASALWEAKQALRNERDASGRTRYRVSDWAGWILTGEPR